MTDKSRQTPAATLTCLQTLVNTNPFAASMSATNFKDPWNFDPERWLGSNKTDILEASQPFSMGPRACLGRTYVSFWFRTSICTLTFMQAGVDGASHCAC